LPFCLCVRRRRLIKDENANTRIEGENEKEIRKQSITGSIKFGKSWITPCRLNIGKMLAPGYIA
jgi:hypothetical protein